MSPSTRTAAFDLATPWKTDYAYREGEPSSELFLLLHGFSQSGGAHTFEKLKDALPAAATILSPNGPLPVPRFGEDGKLERIGYAWYAYDPKTDEYLVEPEFAIRALSALLAETGLAGRRTTIIGYSQGGYLAPMLAARLPQVHRVVGIACEFLSDEIPGEIHFRMDAIHGEEDEVVSPEGSRRAFEALRRRGVVGEHRMLSGVRHGIAPKVLAALKSIL